MADNEDIHLTRTEARGGDSNPTNRLVLPISLALVIILFAVIYFIWQ